MHVLCIKDTFINLNIDTKLGKIINAHEKTFKGILI